MRDIKFRGRRLDNGEWAYGYLYGKSAIIELTSNYTVTSIGTIITGVDEVVIGTVGQFTGLFDKNGVEIYEGDILLTDLSRPYLVVEFINGSFMYQCHDSGKSYYDLIIPIYSEDNQDKYSEVIGNIHQNPELLR